MFANPLFVGVTPGDAAHTTASAEMTGALGAAALHFSVCEQPCGAPAFAPKGVACLHSPAPEEVSESDKSCNSAEECDGLESPDVCVEPASKPRHTPMVVAVGSHSLPGGKRPALPAPWILPMLRSQFFGPCDRHRHHKKNECTFFCTTCGLKPHSACQHCMGSHAGHHVVQIRRYVYCDVVRVADISPYVDTTGVQNYIINQAKVMFLNHRPHSKVGRSDAPDVYRTCFRHLREGCTYCSLACKVEALVSGEPGAPVFEASASAAAAGSAAAAALACPSSELDSSEADEGYGYCGGVDPSGDSEDDDDEAQPAAKRIRVDADDVPIGRQSSDQSSDEFYVLAAFAFRRSSSGTLRSPGSRRKQNTPLRSPVV